MLPPELLARLDQALGTVTRGATRPRRHKARLEEAGVVLSLPGYWMLHELGRTGPTAMTALADAADVPMPLASREVKVLVAAGLVTRTVAPHDSRVAVLRITDDGRRAAERYRRAGQRQIEAVVEGWSTQDVASLADLLERFAAEVRRIQQTS